MYGITIYEFDLLSQSASDVFSAAGIHAIPARVFVWLEAQCLRTAEERETPWLRVTHRCGRRVVQVTSFVGVIRTPDGYQIEVLPKIGKVAGSVVETRQLLIDMLCCLQEFRHVQTDKAKLLAVHATLLEIFVAEFLRSVEHVVKRGLRSCYARLADDLFALRGKLLVGPQLRRNLCRADRFFAEYDEFSTDRPENRLLHAALRAILSFSTSLSSQRLARELCFVFADVPLPAEARVDFQQVRLDRDMGYYSDALAWARLILGGDSPLTGAGSHAAPSLLFPMEAVFEAFVAKHMARQVVRPLVLKAQARGCHLVRHREQNWFQLKPDLTIRNGTRDVLVLDTKWKLLDSSKTAGADKYGLSQSDFYQLLAYGQSYLDGRGDVVLIYPKTAAFSEPLPVFEFQKPEGLKLWVLPFCLKSRQLLVPESAPFASSLVKK